MAGWPLLVSMGRDDGRHQQKPWPPKDRGEQRYQRTVDHLSELANGFHAMLDTWELINLRWTRWSH